jgi:hypothetical protein
MLRREMHDMTDFAAESLAAGEVGGLATINLNSNRGGKSVFITRRSSYARYPSATGSSDGAMSNSSPSEVTAISFMTD